MINDDLTVFDIKYNEGMERLNNLLSSENTTSSIKNYVERYRLDKSRENRISQKNNNTSNNRNILKEDKRKQIVDLYEIRDHDKKVQQLINKNYLKNEIEWFKIKKREDEHKNKYNYNKTKFENDSSINQQDINKDIIRNNNIKMKKFSSLANKVNIDKFKQIKKLNENQNKNFNPNSEQKAKTQFSPNDIKDGVFIPYSEYLEYEKNKNNKNKQIKLNINDINNYNPYNKKIEKKNNNIIMNKNINKNNIIIKSTNIPKKNQIINNNIIQNNNNINNNKSYSIKKLNNNNNNNINNQGISTNINRDLKNKENNKKRNKSSIPKDNDKRYQIDIRKPLGKKIDYLRERKTSQDQRVKIYESKNLFKDKKNIMNNIELLNFHSKKYENEAKMQEQLMRVKGNKQYGNDDNVNLSNLLIDSISTKLAILNQISSNN